MVTYLPGDARRAKLGSVLKAIADPRRRHILDLLAKRDLPVGLIADRFSMSRPAVIKHLAILRSANLISVRRLGRQRIQCLNAAPLKSVEAWISRFEGFWEHSLQKLRRQVESDL